MDVAMASDTGSAAQQPLGDATGAAPAVQQPIVDPALEALQKQQETNMLFAAYTADQNGHVVGTHTNWDIAPSRSDKACDPCRAHNYNCTRDDITQECGSCAEKDIDCVGPGSARRTRVYDGVDTSLPGQKPVYDEYEVGQAVMLRDQNGQWNNAPRLVKKVIYRPVAVVLEEETEDSANPQRANKVIPIDAIRPFDPAFLARVNLANQSRAASQQPRPQQAQAQQPPSTSVSMLEKTLAPSTSGGQAAGEQSQNSHNPGNSDDIDVKPSVA